MQIKRGTTQIFFCCQLKIKHGIVQVVALYYNYLYCIVLAVIFLVMYQTKPTSVVSQIEEIQRMIHGLLVEGYEINEHVQVYVSIEKLPPYGMTLKYISNTSLER